MNYIDAGRRENRTKNEAENSNKADKWCFKMKIIHISIFFSTWKLSK